MCRKVMSMGLMTAAALMSAKKVTSTVNSTLILYVLL